MKKYTYILFTLAFISMSYAQETKVSWLTDFEEAQKLSREEQKPILLYFTGSDWCAPCKMLKADFFESEDFMARADQLILLKADFPRNRDLITETQRLQNSDLLTQYNPKGSFPTLVFLNSKGKKMASISGYNVMRDTKRHFDFIDHGINRF